MKAPISQSDLVIEGDFPADAKQIATWVDVYDPLNSGTISQRVRAVWDSGATRSGISSSLATEMGLTHFTFHGVCDLDNDAPTPRKVFDIGLIIKGVDIGFTPGSLRVFRGESFNHNWNGSHQ